MPRTAPTTVSEDGGKRGRRSSSPISSSVSKPSPAEICTSRRLKNFAPNHSQLRGTVRVAKSYLPQFNKFISFNGSFTYRAVPGPTIDHSEPQVGTTNGSVPDGREACQQLSMPSPSHQKSIP